MQPSEVGVKMGPGRRDSGTIGAQPPPARGLPAASRFHPLKNRSVGVDVARWLGASSMFVEGQILRSIGIGYGLMLMMRLPLWGNAEAEATCIRYLSSLEEFPLALTATRGMAI